MVCGRLSTLSASLSSIRAISDACVVACISNFITGSPSASEPGSLSQKIDPLFKGFLEKILVACRKKPEVQFFICPPMYRTLPLWYRDGISDIMDKFASVMKMKGQERPSNLWLMPSFTSVKLVADGVHLDPISGAEYVLYLVEKPQELVDTANLDCDQRIDTLTGDSRVVQDRLHVLEQDHARLRVQFESSTAVNAELHDFAENLRNECFLMIQGLPRLPKLDSKEWQARAKAQVDQVFRDMGFEHKSGYVQNSTGRGNDSRVLYKVCLESADVSKSIRSKFGSYFTGGGDTRPQSLAGLSIRNCVTPATLGRIAIMQLIGKKYKDANPGSRFQMISYEARPVLKLIPSPDASDRRVQSFNFIEAVTKLPSEFTPEEAEGLIKRISTRLHDSLRSLFVVLTEDMIKKKKSGKAKQNPRSSVRSGGSSAAVVSATDEESGSPVLGGARAGRKRAPSASGSGPSAKK